MGLKRAYARSCASIRITHFKSENREVSSRSLMEEDPIHVDREFVTDIGSHIPSGDRSLCMFVNNQGGAIVGPYLRHAYLKEPFGMINVVLHESKKAALVTFLTGKSYKEIGPNTYQSKGRVTVVVQFTEDTELFEEMEYDQKPLPGMNYFEDLLIWKPNDEELEDDLYAGFFPNDSNVLHHEILDNLDAKVCTRLGMAINETADTALIKKGFTIREQWEL